MGITRRGFLKGLVAGIASTSPLSVLAKQKLNNEFLFDITILGWEKYHPFIIQMKYKQLMSILSNSDYETFGDNEKFNRIVTQILNKQEKEFSVYEILYLLIAETFSIINKKNLEEFLKENNCYKKIYPFGLLPEEKGDITKPIVEIIELIENNNLIDSLKEELLFLYLIGIWKKFNHPDEGKTKEQTILTHIGKHGGFVVSALKYFAIPKVNFFKEGGHIMTKKGEKLLKKFAPYNGLVTNNYYQDMAVLYQKIRHQYFIPKLRKALNEESMEKILYIINEHRISFYQKLRKIKQETISNNFPINEETLNPKIQEAMMNYIFSKKDNKNLMKKLLRKLNSEGVEIKGYEYGKYPDELEIRINSSKLNSKLRITLDKYSSQYGIFHLIPNFLAVVETSYGLNNVTSDSGAKGSIQVMPSTYERFTNKTNFATASDDELIEAGFLKLVNDMKNLGIQNLNAEPSELETMLIGIAYNGGEEKVIDIIKERKFDPTDETEEYYIFLLLIKDSNLFY